MILLTEIIKELRIDINVPNNKRVIMSRKPITLNTNKVYTQPSAMVAFEKPQGLWYGFGNAWIKWVRSEMPEWEGNYLYEVDLGGSNILVLKTVGDMISFYKRFSGGKKKGYMSGFGGAYDIPIQWDNVSKKYDGIEIPKYFNSLRMVMTWYYGWDIASGCIWNLKNVSLKLMESPQV